MYLGEEYGLRNFHYSIFSILLALPVSEIQIFLSAPCSQIPSNSVPPVGYDTAFNTEIKQQVKLLFTGSISSLDKRREGKGFRTSCS
jgi:hypothetical protein